MAKLLDENGLEIVKNWISDNFLKLQGGGDLVLASKQVINIKSSNGNYIGKITGNSRIVLVDYYDNSTGDYSGMGIELDGQGDGTIRVGGTGEFGALVTVDLTINNYRFDVNKAVELGILTK